MKTRVTSIIIPAKDFPRAVQLREDGVGIIRRLPTDARLGVRYEVILIPPERSPYKDFQE